jgi:hypothetical protein
VPVPFRSTGWCRPVVHWIQSLPTKEAARRSDGHTSVPLDPYLHLLRIAAQHDTTARSLLIPSYHGGQSTTSLQSPSSSAVTIHAGDLKPGTRDRRL